MGKPTTESARAYAAKDVGLAKLTINDLAKLREIILDVIEAENTEGKFKGPWDLSAENIPLHDVAEERKDFCDAIQKKIQDTWEK